MPTLGTADARFGGLHVLADDDARWGRDPVEQARAACEGGAAVVQLRAKHATDRTALAWARAIRSLTRGHGVTFVMNDRSDLAVLAEADAVHLGQDDLEPAAAAACSGICGQSLGVGISTHTLEQAQAARGQPLDYVAFGPLFGTASKTSPYTPRGLDALREVVRAVAPLPVVAIGGIDVTHAREVVRAGAAGVAVISTIAAAADPREAARRLAAALAEERA